MCFFMFQFDLILFIYIYIHSLFTHVAKVAFEGVFLRWIGEDNLFLAAGHLWQGNAYLEGPIL